MAESGVPPTETQASDVEDGEIPAKLPSDVGMDYVPLATMLATGQLLEADQVRFIVYSDLFVYTIMEFRDFTLVVQQMMILIKYLKLCHW